MMNTDKPQSYNFFLARLIAVNLFFAALMVSASFIVLLSRDYYLWQNCPKADIVKVFIQNIRFNLSVTAYFNIPVLVFLLLILAFRPPRIMKSFVSFVKSFYLSAFLAAASLAILSYLLKNSSAVEKFFSRDCFSGFSFICASFDNPVFIMLFTAMSALFLAAAVFFLLLVKFVFKPKEYAIDDYGKAVVSTVLLLLICVFAAKGKITGRLSLKDADVTPSAQLNGYAAQGAYTILHKLKNFDFYKIAVIKNGDLLKNGTVVSDDEEKEREDFYRFTPKTRR